MFCVSLNELLGLFPFLILCHFFCFFLTAPPLPFRAVTLYVVHQQRTQLQALIAISQGWGAYKLGDKQDFQHAGWQRPGNGNEKLYITISMTILFMQPGITLTLYNNSQMTVTAVRQQRDAPHKHLPSEQHLCPGFIVMLRCDAICMLFERT